MSPVIESFISPEL
jgi:hypothetical protein